MNKINRRTAMVATGAIIAGGMVDPLGAVERPNPIYYNDDELHMNDHKLRLQDVAVNPELVMKVMPGPPEFVKTPDVGCTIHFWRSDYLLESVHVLENFEETVKKLNEPAVKGLTGLVKFKEIKGKL